MLSVAVKQLLLVLATLHRSVWDWNVTTGVRKSGLVLPVYLFYCSYIHSSLFFLRLRNYNW